MTEPKAPVIIIGMHRSGTSMIADTLKQFGLFIGHKLLPFRLYEALFFVRLNEWLLAQANTTWDNTYNYQFVDDVFVEQAKNIIVGELKGRAKKEFLGKYKFRDIRLLDIPWGWKDPRSTITIDLWKSIFPNAKLLHIYRNPIDVAASLAKRESDIRTSTKITYSLRILRFLSYKATQNLSLRAMHIEEGIKLWQEYVSKAFALDARYASDIYHLKYEDFVQSPTDYLAEVVEFAGLIPEDQKVNAMAGRINSDRKNAFMKQPELVDLYRKIKDNYWIQKLGYGSIL